MWSYKPPNWVIMDPIERYAYPLSSSSLWWHLHRSCSDEALKLVNSISLVWDSHLCKTTQLFYVFTLKNSQWFIKGHKSFIQNQKVRDTCLYLQVKENHMGKIVTKPTSRNHWRTEVPTVNICLKPLSFWSEGQAVINLCLNPSRTLAKPINTPWKIKKGR